MILTRYGSTPKGTFGELQVGNLLLYTVERPWLDNKPFHSCIPSGEYQVIPHSSKAHPNVWALVGETVSHYKEQGIERYGVLIHVGNWMKDVVGCIAPGTGLGDSWNVTGSRNAINLLRDSIEDILTIKWQNNEL